MGFRFRRSIDAARRLPLMHDGRCGGPVAGVEAAANRLAPDGSLSPDRALTTGPAIAVVGVLAGAEAIIGIILLGLMVAGSRTARDIEDYFHRMSRAQYVSLPRLSSGEVAYPLELGRVVRHQRQSEGSGVGSDEQVVRANQGASPPEVRANLRAVPRGVLGELQDLDVEKEAHGLSGPVRVDYPTPAIHAGRRMNVDRRRFAKSLTGVVGALAARPEGDSRVSDARTPPHWWNLPADGAVPAVLRRGPGSRRAVSDPESRSCGC